MSEVTPWFAPEVKPVRVGVYETYLRGYKELYQNWNGKFWGMAAESPEDAYIYRHSKSFFQNDKWRGLSSDPSKRKKLK